MDDLAATLKNDFEATLKWLAKMYREAPVGLCLLDRELRYVFINEWLAELNGTSVEGHLGRTVREVLPDVAPGVESQLRHVLQTSEPLIAGFVEAETPAHPNAKRVFEHNYQPVVGDDGTVLGVSCAVQDVTERWRATERLEREIVERKRAEEGMQKSNERLRAVLATAADAIVTIDHRGIVGSINSAGERLFGYKADELIGQNVNILMPSPVSDEHDGFLSQYLRTGQGKIIGVGREVVGRHKDGTTIPLDLAISEMWIGHRRFFTGIMRDLTERNKAEELISLQQEEVSHLARLHVMGEMATTIAHELNQPLAAILTYTHGCIDLLRSGVQDSDHLFEALEQAAGQAQRAGAIIRRLRSFVRKHEPERSAFSIHDIVRETTGFMGHQIRLRGVELRLDFAAAIPLVLADSIQVQQVLFNLIRNALDAMEEGGSDRAVLVIQTSSTAVEDADVVEVSVQDTGPGLPDESLDQVFHPFFTNKPEGLGLGLSISRSIVEAQGGRLWAVTNPGGGMIFRFTLPACQQTSDSER